MCSTQTPKVMAMELTGPINDVRSHGGPLPENLPDYKHIVKSLFKGVTCNRHVVTLSY